MDRFTVITSAAKMPGNCMGQYRHVAVVECDTDALFVAGIKAPKMISDRAFGAVRIVSVQRRLNVGSTDRCAYEVALASAQLEAESLNASYYAANPDQLEADIARSA